MAGYMPECEDWKFIFEISNRFPERKIMERFVEFLDMEPRSRPLIAEFRKSAVDREGWNEIGVKPKVQSLEDHVRTNMEMVRLLTPADINKDHLALMNEDHDTSEVITSDFTWDVPITKREKIRIERLATNVIFESAPERIRRWEEYVTKRTNAAKMLNDFDKLENIYEAEILEPENLHLHPVLNQWKKDVWGVLKTDHGRRIFNYLMDTQDQAGTISKFERIAQTARYIMV
jgi:hypothetical protein